MLGTANALLPTADGVGTDIEIGGKEGLAGVELAADLANFSGGDGPGARGDACNAEVHGFAALVGCRALERFPHVVEDVYLDFLRHRDGPNPLEDCGTGRPPMSAAKKKGGSGLA